MVKTHIRSYRRLFDKEGTRCGFFPGTSRGFTIMNLCVHVLFKGQESFSRKSLWAFVSNLRNKDARGWAAESFKTATLGWVSESYVRKPLWAEYQKASCESHSGLSIKKLPAKATLGWVFKSSVRTPLWVGCRKSSWKSHSGLNVENLREKATLGWVSKIFVKKPLWVECLKASWESHSGLSV